MICLRDPLMIADNMLLVPHHVFFIIALFDGEHSIVDIQAEYTRQFGELLFSDKIQEIIERLDESLFLESERFHRARQEKIDAFGRSPIRSATHAGTAYENEPTKLRAQLDAVLSTDCPSVTEPPTGTLRALVAPHIDIRRGGSCYAASYRELGRECTARTFIVLGVSHTYTSTKYVLTRKDFATPLGVCRTDASLVDRLQAGCSTDLFVDEFAHRNEHSLEFQIVFLHHLFGGTREITIVPVLCSSFQSSIDGSGMPDEEAEVGGFLDALGGLLRERGSEICCIAGVDLSHVGRRFGQDLTLAPSLLHELECHDRQMLQQVLDIDAEGFFRFIQSERDARNVCGVSALYTLLRTVNARTSRLLGYEQAVDSENHSVVTFAGAAFYG